MSSPPPATDQLEFTHITKVDGHRYTVSVASDTATSDTIIVDVLGADPMCSVTIDSRITGTITSLAHLGPVLTEAFDGLAAQHGTPPAAASTRTTQKPRRRGGGLPTNSHQPWTDELKATLSAAWLAADPHLAPRELVDALANTLDVTPDVVLAQFPYDAATSEPAAVIAVIAHVMKRSVVAIQSQLPRLNLAPERPGPTGVNP